MFQTALPDDGRNPPPPECTVGPSRLAGRAVAFGLFAGWLNLAEVSVQKSLNPSIPMAALRTNRHALWMIPTSSVVLFGLVGVALALFGRRRWSTAERASWPVLTGLLVLTLLLDVQGLHPIASLVLALGMGLRLGGRVARLAAAGRRVLRPVVGLAAAALVALSLVNATWVHTAESRALAALPPPATDAPNVLLLVLDNVRAESMSLYGHERPTTANLDRLASRGTLFQEARSTSSWTLPSHASLMTGRWCNELNFGFDRPLDATHPTLAEVLARSGYATAGFVGNTYYANAVYGLSRGFARYEDHYENLEVSLFEVVRSTGLGKRVLHALGYPIDVQEGASIRKTAAMLNRDLLAWIDQQPTGRPFFGFVNYFDAHAPFLTPRGFETRLGTAALPASEKSAILKRSARLGSIPAKPGEDPEAIRKQADDVARDSYETCLAYLDQELGRLFDELDRRGLNKRTLVILTSDHGEHFGERGFSGHGRSLYRPEVHVPLLVFWPQGTGERGPSKVEVPVSNRDVAATVADAIGLAAASPFPGSSLARFKRSPVESRGAAVVLSEIDHQTDLVPMRAVPASRGPVKALVMNNKVFIRSGDDEMELYDLLADRHELRNLLDAPPASNVASASPRLDAYQSMLERLTNPDALARSAANLESRRRR